MGKLMSLVLVIMFLALRRTGEIFCLDFVVVFNCANSGSYVPGPESRRS